MIQLSSVDTYIHKQTQRMLGMRVILSDKAKFEKQCPVKGEKMLSIGGGGEETLQHNALIENWSFTNNKGNER